MNTPSKPGKRQPLGPGWSIFYGSVLLVFASYIIWRNDINTARGSYVRHINLQDNPGEYIFYLGCIIIPALFLFFNADRQLSSNNKSQNKSN
jgi:hypothetical protein